MCFVLQCNVEPSTVSFLQPTFCNMLEFLFLRLSKSALGSLSSVAARAQIIYRHQDTLEWRVVRTSAIIVLFPDRPEPDLQVVGFVVYKSLSLFRRGGTSSGNLNDK